MSPPALLTATNQYGEYWKTSALSFGVLYFLAVFPLTGFLGLDHLYARSPKTAFLKFLVNCMTFGWWYIYEVILSVYRSDQVKIFGLSAPLWGPLGVGAGQFMGDSKGSETASRFFIYALLVAFVPFGIDYFYMGRWGMGALKLFCTVIPIFILVALVIGAWNIMKVMFLTGGLLDENYEFFGSELSMKGKIAKSLEVQYNIGGGFLGWIQKTLIALMQSDLVMAIPVVGPLIQLANTSLNTATIAVDAAGSAIEAGKPVVLASIRSAGVVVDKTRKTATNILDAAGESAKGVAAIAGQADRIQSAINPASAVAAIESATAVQTGGGDSSPGQNLATQLVLGVLALVVVSGGLATLWRVFQNRTTQTDGFRSAESDSKKTYDRPPDAGPA